MDSTTTTGFSDVDASGISEDLVSYLGVLARVTAELRRDGFALAGLRAGQAILDVGCGAGEVCVELGGLADRGLACQRTEVFAAKAVEWREAPQYRQVERLVGHGACSPGCAMVPGTVGRDPITAIAGVMRPACAIPDQGENVTRIAVPAARAVR